MAKRAARSKKTSAERAARAKKATRKKKTESVNARERERPTLITVPPPPSFFVAPPADDCTSEYIIVGRCFVDYRDPFPFDWFMTVKNGRPFRAALKVYAEAIQGSEQLAHNNIVLSQMDSRPTCTFPPSFSPPPLPESGSYGSLDDLKVPNLLFIASHKSKPWPTEPSAPLPVWSGWCRWREAKEMACYLRELCSDNLSEMERLFGAFIDAGELFRSNVRFAVLDLEKLGRADQARLQSDLADALARRWDGGVGKLANSLAMEAERAARVFVRGERQSEATAVSLGKQKWRPAYDRDHKWLDWYEAEGTDTFHSHAKIRTKHYEETGENVSREVVITAIKKATKERDEGVGK
ncbi:MAG: hypothetical protein RIC55_09500 [Pirellulaceae bacterium]